MTRDKYIRQLNDIKRMTLQMGEQAEGLVNMSITSLTEQNVGMADQVIAKDKDIDELYLKIEKKVIKIIATQAPVASDLRLLLTVLKNTTDVERVGDFAKDIAEITKELKDDKYFTELIIIPKMAETTLNMVRESLEAFDKEDVELARKVHEQDDIVDKMFSRVFRAMTTFVMENPKNIGQALRLLLVARHLERIADHAVNIANRTIYYIDGKVKYI